MKLKKLKFESVGSFGGNMEALESYRRNHQILLSNCFGDVPSEGSDWGVSIYKKTSLGDYDEEPIVSFSGENFTLEKAEKKARELLAEVLYSNLHN